MKAVLLICGGALLGLVAGYALRAFDLVHLSPAPAAWKTTEALIGRDGLRIPSGTTIVYSHSMAEGFTVVKVYLNMDAGAFKKTERRTDQRFLETASEWVH